jgi:hypothetical protein
MQRPSLTHSQIAWWCCPKPCANLCIFFHGAGHALLNEIKVTTSTEGTLTHACNKQHTRGPRDN